MEGEEEGGRGVAGAAEKGGGGAVRVVVEEGGAGEGEGDVEEEGEGAVVVVKRCRWSWVSRGGGMAEGVGGGEGGGLGGILLGLHAFYTKEAINTICRTRARGASNQWGGMWTLWRTCCFLPSVSVSAVGVDVGDVDRSHRATDSDLSYQ